MTKREETEEQTTAIAKREQPKAELVIGDRVAGGLMPRTIDELWRMSEWFSRSGMMPKGMDRPEQVAVAVQMGLEVGLAPMQAVQNIAVINGRPSLWGDAAMALVRSSGLCEWIEESPVVDEKKATIGFCCRSKRRGEKNICERTFTLSDAKTAGLVGKGGPWSQYPARMLQMRARSWVLRDLYPDVLRGLSVREEAEDSTVISVTAVEEPRQIEAPSPAAELERRVAAKRTAALDNGNGEQSTNLL